jgi:hypothetical protein
MGQTEKVLRCSREVGFAFKNGHRQSGLSGPKSANKRLMHRSKLTRHAASVAAPRDNA